MVNPKTSMLGILVLLAALSTLGVHLFTSGLSTADLQAVVGGLAGLGLIHAKDGTA